MKVGISAKPDVRNLEELVKKVEGALGDENETLFDVDVAKVLGKEPIPID